jgi:hypothetical protein
VSDSKKAPTVYETCAVNLDGPGPFEEDVARTKRSYELLGWFFVEALYPTNAPPKLIFRRAKE